MIARAVCCGITIAPDAGRITLASPLAAGPLTDLTRARGTLRTEQRIVRLSVAIVVNAVITHFGLYARSGARRPVTLLTDTLAGVATVIALLRLRPAARGPHTK